MADLQDVINKLTNEGELIRNKGAHSIKSVKEIILKNQDTPAEKKQNLEDARNAANKTNNLLASIAKGISISDKPDSNTSSGKKSGGLFGGLKGMGAGIGAAIAGSALLKSAAGIAAMGVAIPAFFGGLLAGDAALSWMKSIGADFDFKSLKAAAIGFSDIIMSMDIKAFAVLGTIMGLGAIGGTKAALGVGAMGIGISAFLGGLLAGDALITGAASVFGADLNFTGMKKALTGFSDMIVGLTPQAQVALGALIVAGATAGILAKTPAGALQIGIGMTALGAGISGLFVGLAAGDVGMKWLNSDFTAIAKAMKGFDTAIGNLSTESIKALGVLLVTGFGIGKLTNPATKVKLVTGIGTLIAGIAAFFAGFAGMDAIARTFGEGDSASKLIKNFSEAIGHLDEKSMISLGSILGIGALFGAVSGPLAAKASIGMGILGLGIAGFFASFALIDAAARKLGEGKSAANLIKNFSEAIGYLDERSMIALGSMLAIGGLFGAVSGPLAAMAAVGMGLIGAGIGAFFVGIDAVSKLGAAVGIDGSNTKKLIKNMSEGLKHLVELDGNKLTKIGNALVPISRGLAAFFATDTFGSIKEGVGGAFDFFFGNGGKDNKFQKIVDALKPLEQIDADKMGGLNKILPDLERLGNVNIQDGFGQKIRKFAQGLLLALPPLELALYGGVIPKGNSLTPGMKGFKKDVSVKGLANGGQQFEKAIANLTKLTNPNAAGQNANKSNTSADNSVDLKPTNIESLQNSIDALTAQIAKIPVGGNTTLNQQNNNGAPPVYTGSPPPVGNSRYNGLNRIGDVPF
jgi:hypothetical protein